MTDQSVIYRYMMLELEMARPKSEEKRAAILAAATALLSEHGLGAATAEIARKAGVPSGSVFTYFATKAELFTALYVELSGEMTDIVMAGMPSGKGEQAEFQHLWIQWTTSGASNPAKRRAQALLKMSADRSRADAYATPVFDLIQRVSARGVLREAPVAYVIELVAAWVSTTIDFMIIHPDQADRYCQHGLDAAWHALN